MCLLFFQRIGGGGWPRLPIENAILNILGSSTLATYGPLSEYKPRLPNTGVLEPTVWLQLNAHSVVACGCSLNIIASHYWSLVGIILAPSHRHHEQPPRPQVCCPS